MTTGKVTMLSRALEQINCWRRINDAEPLEQMPCGQVGSHCHCPVANALDFGENVSVGQNVIAITIDGTRHHWFPGYAVVRFIQAFDIGDYPDLIAI